MSFPKIEGYVVTEKLGTGSYSTVYKGYTKVGARTVVAVKCVDKARVKHSGSAVDNLVTEIRLLKTLTHPHIVQMREFTWDDKNIYIIMEYCCGGDLSKYIHRYGRVPEKQVLYFLQQLASALKFLREKGVVHMDLKPHNLLLHKGSDGKYILKVADFGFATILSAESRLRMVRGSPLYMAPEMLQGEYGASVDLWSVGVIMYECLFGKAPYSSSTLKELIDKIQNRTPIVLPPNSSISAGCQDLLTRLLQHDPDERISYEEFFRHAYLDLEHMPSKENYDKAVTLIKQAVELDSAGCLEEAFGAYCASLRYLVPVVHCESDAMRRQALRAKLTRYMERAEEIKQLLRSPATPPAVGTVAPPPRRQYNCCGKEEGGNSYDFGTSGVVETPASAACACAHGSAGGCACDGAPAEKTPSDPRPGRAKETKDKASRSPVRSRLKKLFGIQGVPYLDTDSVAEDSAQTNKQKLPGEGDACRIT
ncbi:unc-51 like kinase 3 homolog Aduk [Choristoneura fumiferana]|uniref:unc-51 like kinase 3 homolog Aduk n=1 Tax=Choristoneura fumiferana TaxID=7141 RepID=UPI003D15E4ED